VGILFDRYDSIIPLLIFFVALLRLQLPQSAGRLGHTRKAGSSIKDQHIDWIAVVGLGRRNKSEVIRKVIPMAALSSVQKTCSSALECELVSTSLWGFNHNPPTTVYHSNRKA